MVWKLNRCLYGLVQSPRNFYQYNAKKLDSIGFKPSETDLCLFIRDDAIILIYVDDALVFFRNKEAADNLFTQMRDIDLHFEEEDSVAGFLGVHIDRREDGSILLSQKGLTERIIETLNLTSESIKPLERPASKHLPIDEDGELAHGDFSYPSVVGQINYLQGHTRPDICFAFSQCARFLHKPRRSHELALVELGRYLKGTVKEGLILRPSRDDTFKMDVYVDVSFAGGWNSELSTSPESVKSRTGYIIEVAGCPVTWASSIQPIIATSTMESEYYALSTALRTVIPLLDLIKAICSGLGFTKHRLLTFRATVHEDNQGALILANLEPGRHTPRSKHYALRLHWFRSWLKPKHIEIVFVSTKEQKSDMMTKSLPVAVFKANRKLSMGW